MPLTPGTFLHAPVSVDGLQPPKPVRPRAALPNPPRDAAVARVIGVCPIVLAGRVNCEVFNLADPVLLENVLDRAALVKRPSDVLYNGWAPVMPARLPSMLPIR